MRRYRSTKLPCIGKRRPVQVAAGINGGTLFEASEMSQAIKLFETETDRVRNS